MAGFYIDERSFFCYNEFIKVSDSRALLPKLAILPGNETKIKIKLNMSEQEKRNMLSSSDLVSISQVYNVTPYSQEYLSLLARKGKIPAIKIARDWLTTRRAVLSYVKRQKKKHLNLVNRFEKVGGVL
jgi:hypothetical protein